MQCLIFQKTREREHPSWRQSLEGQSPIIHQCLIKCIQTHRNSNKWKEIEARREFLFMMQNNNRVFRALAKMIRKIHQRNLQNHSRLLKAIVLLIVLFICLEILNRNYCIRWLGYYLIVPLWKEIVHWEFSVSFFHIPSFHIW